MPRRSHDHADERKSSAAPLSELPLFAPPTRPAAPDSFSDHAPSVKGSKTSAKAAREAAPRARSQQLRIEDYIREQGARGATRGEISAALGVRPSSVNARIVTSYVQGWIGSNGDERRGPNAGDGMQEVLLWETYVTRWHGVQRRPANRLPVESGALTRARAND